MFKKIVFIFFIAVINLPVDAQVLYEEHFDLLSLNTATYSYNGTQTYKYADVPASMPTINNGSKTADTLTGNYPFRANGQKQKAWLAYMPSNVSDTFAVSTSWLNPAGGADSWLITPVINNIAANSVLTWEAMAPDNANADGYDVYITSNTAGTPVVSDFTSGTKLVAIASEQNSWQTRGVSLAAYAGQNVRIAFRNNSNDKYQLWIDDIVVHNNSVSFDGNLLFTKVYKYSTTNTNNVISARFKNNGSQIANNITVNYQLGSLPVISETKTMTPSLNYLEEQDVSFTLPFSSPTPGYYSLKIWVSAVNGQTDQAHNNDTLYSSISLVNSIATKNVLLEAFASAKSGQSPDAFTQLNAVAANSNAIVVSHHQTDNLSTTEGTALYNNYSSKIPAALIDQFSFPDNNISINPNDWNNYIAQRLAMKVPASVSLSGLNYNTSTRQLDVTVTADFVSDVMGDYRLNLYVKENNVFGPLSDVTDNGWNQYNSSYSIPSSNYYQTGTYLNSTTYLMNANEFKHQYVVEHVADGTYGVAGTIPSTLITNGQSFSKNYSYVLPAVSSGEFRFNPDNMYLVGILSEYHADVKQRAIINAAEIKLNTNPETVVSVNEHAALLTNAGVFPNPAKDYTILTFRQTNREDVSLHIYNNLGELVRAEILNYPLGEVNHKINTSQLAEGHYTVLITKRDYRLSKKLLIIK